MEYLYGIQYPSTNCTMKHALFFLAPCLMLSAMTAHAQFQGKVYEEDTSVAVNAFSNIKTLAWCGGINNPQFSLADLNGDGRQDLVIFQSDQSSVKTFINTGSAVSPDYRYAPQYAANFPAVNNYLVLKDYNGDGISDLFHWGGAGISISRGYYNSASQLSFTYYKDLFYNNNSKLHGTLVNAEVNPGDIPAIVDVDNDGDLDFLSYYGDGYYMAWYQNLQQDLGLHKDSVRIRLADQCWGKMVQFSLREHHLGVYCDNSYLLKKTADDIPRTAKVTDGGNTPCLIDMDGDGDYDVLDGHRAFSYMVYLRNGRNGGLTDSMVYQDTTYTTLGDTVKISQWPAAFHLDIDHDGARDLLVAPNALAGSENYNCVRFYKNEGTDAVPSFRFQSDSFLVDKMIDMGSNSYPFFYDYNKDGKPDLFVGSRGYYDKASGQLYARVAYYENTTSAPGNPSLNLVTEDFMGWGALKYKGISIGIGDIDDDGKDEFLMGHFDGTVDIVRNTAASGTVQPVWSTAPAALLDGSGVAIATNSSSVPLVYDMNKDGKTDLVIGDQLGYLFYYQNISSTPGTANLLLTNNMLGFVKSDPEKTSSGHSTPFIGKMDNTGNDYLLMGSRSGRIFRFTGFQTGSVITHYPRLDSAYSFILSDQFVYTSYMSAPAVADIDGDGKYEMVVGNVYGGLLLYRQAKTVSVPEAAAAEPRLALFPNPAQDRLYLNLENMSFSGQVSASIYNSMGQLVIRQERFADPRNLDIDIRQLAPAVYICVLSNGSGSYSAVFVKR